MAGGDTILHERTNPATSPGGILSLLRSAGSLTRKELQDRVGLSRATLVDRLDALQHARLIRTAGRRESSGGRRADLLSVDEQSRVALVADLGVSHLTLGLVDLAGAVLDTRRERLRSGNSPERIIPTMLDLAQDVLLASGRKSDLVAFGLSLPGQIDQAAGTTVAPPTIPAWDGYPLREQFTTALDVPVLIENDANALAFGEHLAAGTKGTTLLGVKIGTAIGAGVVIGDSPHRGATGCAGEIGHIKVVGCDEKCTCGERGCVAAIASGRALQRQLRHIGVRTVRDVARKVQQGDPVAVDHITNAGRLVGGVLATVVSLVNPKVVRLGGEIGELPPFVTEVSKIIEKQAHAVAVRGLDIGPASLGDTAPLVGLAGLNAEWFFSPAVVDRLVSCH